MKVFLWTLSLALSGCHASCDESTGAAPAAVPDAGQVVGVQPQGIPSMRPIMVRPMMRPQPQAPE